MRDLDAINPAYAFRHDRVQQAAQALTPSSERSASALLVVRRLLRHDPAPEGDRLVVVAGLMVRAVGLARADEAETWARLLLAATEETSRASAFEIAAEFARAGHALLDAAGADPTSELWFELRFRAAGCAWLLGRHEEAEPVYLELDATATDPLVRARVANARVDMYTSLGRFSEAVDAGVDGLALCGVSFPRRPSFARMLAELSWLRLRLRGRDVAALAEQPEMTDPAARRALRLMVGFAAAARFEDQVALTAVLICRMCALTLDHGTLPASAFAWGQYGFLLGPILGDVPRSLALSEMAQTLLDRHDDAEMRPLVLFVRGALVEPWGRLPRQCVPLLERGMQAARAVGNANYVVNNGVVLCSTRLVAGQRLSLIEAECDAGIQFAMRHEVDVIYNTWVVWRQLCRCLQGRTHHPPGFDDDGFDGDAWLETHRDSPFQIVVHGYAMLRMYACHLLGDLDGAVAWGAWSQDLAEVGKGLIYAQLHPCWHAVVLADAARRWPQHRRAHRATIVAHLKTLSSWERWCPDAQRHRRALVQAELAQLDGDLRGALAAYEEAIAHADTFDFLPDSALAHERVGRLHLGEGRRLAGVGYLRVARRAYEAWGASAKVAQLDREIPELALAAPTVAHGGTQTASSTLSSSGQLDLVTVVKATQAISEELVLDRLLVRMVEIVHENAGARRALLLLRRDEGLVVATERGPSGLPDGFAPGPLDARHDLAHAVVRLVDRTGEPQLLDDTDRPGLFAGDPWIASGLPRSILCLPIGRGEDQLGVLYLEHDLVKGAFTPDRLELLSVLSAQIGISLENATLYDQTRRLMRSFERFVPKEFLEQLGKRRLTEVGLGDAVQAEMTVLFADIRQFSALSERLTPEETFRFVNRWLGEVGPIVRRHHGFIDKFIGDAVMALFPRGPADAVRAGVEIQAAARAFDGGVGVLDPGTLRVGVGVHHGRLMLGTIGEEARLESTVLSDAVNVASRLEELTKTYGASMLVSEAVVAALPHGTAAVRFLGEERLRGRQHPTAIYEVVDALDPAERARRDGTLDRWSRAMDAWRAGDLDGARAGFDDVVRADPSDQAARVWATRVGGA